MDARKPYLKRNEYLQGSVSAKGNEADVESTAIFPRPRSSRSGSTSTTTTSAGHENVFCIIGKDSEKPEYRCYPYRKSLFRCFLMILTYICSAGFMWLMFYWRPDWKLKFTHYLTSFEKCTSVFLEDLDGTQRVYVSKIELVDASLKKWAPYLFSKSSAADNLHLKKGGVPTFGSTASLPHKGLVKYFTHHLSKYMWDSELQTFVKVEGYDGNVNLEEVHVSANNPVSKENAETMRELFGENVIHVEIPSHISLLVAEVLNPFYVFQLAACIFWMADDYYVYGTAILVISFISAIVSLITIRRERVALHDMVERHNSARISVIRGIKEQEDYVGPSSIVGGAAMKPKEYVMDDIWIKDLVPGDVVAIPSSGVQLSFDAALISGSCIVNESMLTGESVPVTKTPLPSGESELSKTFHVDEQKAHVLYCGTEVVQTRYYQDEIVRAVVVRTGYGTAKGQLVHSILFPKPVNLELLRDAYRFVGVMCLIALVGFAFSAYTLVKHGESARDIAFKSIDIITITVPPALPLAMTIGIIYAQDRLKKAFIRTISPQRINICGQVDVVAFDKTGTLTEEGLDLAHVVPASTVGFILPLQSKDLKTWDKKSDLVRCMATCHSLTVIEGETSGDPLDLKMFEATGFELVEPTVDETTKYDQLRTTYVRPFPAVCNELTSQGENSMDSVSEYEVGIIRQFPFLSSLQRASVIAKPLMSEPDDMLVYVKGAPETIAKLCMPETVPKDFMHMLKAHTEKGYRVIALSYKSMKLKWRKAQKIERESVEKDLTFLGFMILQNQLKPTSEGVISQLDMARIRSVMVTGDNLETAICVGRDCKILKPGKTILGVKCDVSGTYPSLKWNRIETENSKAKPSLSSSDELSDTVIIMGDNTTVDNCHLVVTGFDFTVIRQYFPQFIKPMAVQGAIFARMSPTQKTELMEELEAVDYHTLMCGDGANDCGALKRAHVGLSLSELEASVAAPFTANIDNGIGSVVTLIREGRAALVTSFGMFKFMALYSMIQFTTILLLYQSNTILSDAQFLYIDLIIIDLIAITMSRNYAYKSLHSKRPSTSLVTLEMLLSLLLQILLQMGLQIFAYLFVQQQCWYRGPIIVNETSREIIHEVASDDGWKLSNETTATPPNYVSCPALAHADNVTSFEEDTPKTYETTTLLYVSAFMYLSVSVAFSHGKPFRTAIYKNKWFLGSLLLLSGITLFLMFYAPLELTEFMLLWRIPDLKFLFFLCGIITVHFIVSLVIERFLIENPYLWNRIKSLCARKTHKKQYKNIETFLQNFKPSRNSPYKNGSRNHGSLITEGIAIPALFDGQTVYSKIPFESYKTNCGFRSHL